MSNETTENFLRVMATFKWPEPITATYRLYYNSDGTPKCYTMEDLPGKYVEVDLETYLATRWNVRVIDGQIKIIDLPVTVQQLRPGTVDGTSCHPQDVCVVVVGSDQGHIKWNKVHNEIS